MIEPTPRLIEPAELDHGTMPIHDCYVWLIEALLDRVKAYDRVQAVGGPESEALLEHATLGWSVDGERRADLAGGFGPEVERAFGPPFLPTYSSSLRLSDAWSMANEETRFDFPAPLAPISTLSLVKSMSD